MYDTIFKISFSIALYSGFIENYSRITITVNNKARTLRTNINQIMRSINKSGFQINGKTLSIVHINSENVHQRNNGNLICHIKNDICCRIEIDSSCV